MPADDSSRPCSGGGGHSTPVNNVLGGQYSLVNNVRGDSSLVNNLRGDSSPVNNVREGTSMGGYTMTPSFVACVVCIYDSTYTV